MEVSLFCISKEKTPQKGEKTRDMPLERLPELLLYILVVGYTPGPANLYAFSCAIRFGRRHALRTWNGMAVGFSIAAVVVALGTHYVGEMLGEYIGYLKYLGAGYILYLAWGTWHAGDDGGREAEACSFRTGMTVQLTNAKMILFELTMYSIFVLPYTDSLTDLLMVTALLHLAGPGANLLWLAAGDMMRDLFVRYRRTSNMVMALALVVCAVLILLP